MHVSVKLIIQTCVKKGFKLADFSSQLTFTSSKPTIGTTIKSVRYVES